MDIRQFTDVKGREYLQTNLKLSFGTTKMAAYANIFCMLVRKKYGNVY